MKLRQTCPRCQERPSRRVLVNTSGKPARCAACYASPNHNHSTNGLTLRRRRLDDKTPAQIDQLYRAAKARMKQQRMRSS